MYKRRFPPVPSIGLQKKVCADSPTIQDGQTEERFQFFQNDTSVFRTPVRFTTQFKTANNKSITVSEESMAKGHILVSKAESEAENLPQPTGNTAENPPKTPCTPVNRLLLSELPTNRVTSYTPPTPVSETLDGFFSISDLHNYKGKNLKVIGFLADNPINTPRSSGLCVASFSLQDDWDDSVKCEVWRRAPLEFGAGTIVLVQARVKIIKVSTVNDTLQVEPDLPEVKRIRTHLNEQAKT